MATGIRFDCVLPLRHIASIKVAISLWNQIHTLRQGRDTWQEIEDEIKQNTGLLRLPRLLERELKCFIHPIRTEIVNWIIDEDNNPIFTAFIDRFCWTTRGAIDKKKTAEMFVRNEELCAADRYKLACKYSIESEIKKLWSTVPESERGSFLYSLQPLLRFWTCFVTNNREAMNILIQEEIGHNRHSVFQSAFMIAAKEGNVVSTAHFWTKLSSREKNESLLETAKYTTRRGHSEVLCFLLSKMNADEQNEVFKSDPFGVLFCLTAWPFQDVLVEIVSHMGHFLLQTDHKSLGNKYHSLLDKIIACKECESDNCIYKQLFTKIWQQTSVKVKQLVISVCPNQGLLLALFRSKDVKNIQLILAEVPQEIKRDILLSYEGTVICNLLLDVNELNLLELFFKECVSSRNDVIAFKEKVKSEFENSSDAIKKILEKIIHNN